MNDIQMGEIESRFADIIWNNEPIASGALAKISEEQLGWKKTTSYTVLRRLCDKGLFQNAKGTVTSLISKREFDSRRSEQFVESAFHGSLPAFLSAFTSRKKLSAYEIEQLRKMVDEFEEEQP
ncbi:MAG: BlaI/MecI/CopY family transcriptional regulator [Ruminococcus sp.]|nr:BlaI/MecI/CopY family transcriptional regulator [Ruminococcus sp.]